jgi:predicted MFS family arabinose efflux permease
MFGTDVRGSSDKRPDMGRWYVVSVLTAIFTVHYIDRAVVSVLIEPIKREFGASDSAMGLLSFTAHSLAVGLCAIPLGLLADRVNRVRLVACLLVIWSGLTALGAIVGSFTQLLLIRFGVGAAESGAPPASVSIIADIFSQRELPTAMGIYYIALGLGTGTTFLIGGYVAQTFGWRTVFLLAGVPGIFLAILLLLTVREPARRVQSEEAGAAPRFGLVPNRTALFVMGAGGVASMTMNAVWVWMASFLIRAHHFNLAEAGVVVAAAGVIGKSVGSVIAGPLTRRLSGDHPSALWRLPSLSLITASILVWLFVSVSTVPMVVLLAVLLGMALGAWASQAIAILLIGTPGILRARTYSTYQVVVSIVGGAGPFLTGLISDRLGGDGHLGVALAATLLLNLFPALFFLLACRSIVAEPGKDVEQRARTADGNGPRPEPSHP